MRARLVAVTLATLTVVATAGAGRAEAPESLLDRSVEPVVLTGVQFPAWSAGPDPTFREPQVPGDALEGNIPADSLHQSDCAAENGAEPEQDGTYAHSCYEASRLPHNPLNGAPVGRLLGYRWNEEAFVQIPFQVDERFTRYLTNNASGFAPYSDVDQHNAYAFDREGFRYTWDQKARTGAGDDCLAWPKPGSTIIESHGGSYATTPDPVVGLDDDDELVFMERDAGAAAPPGTPLPDGIELAFAVTVTDPASPAAPEFVYVMLAAEGGPAPEFTAENSPYVRYARDAGADIMVFSESSYEGYGNAPKGPYCNEDGTLAAGVDPANKATWRQRRPLDRATITTPRYSFRYEGRWLMTELKVSNTADGDWSYGPDIIDRWKARAFAQDPGSDTPCCGYEEEDTNWGGSSILMGERWGPVRAIRETWGADSSTNNARREVFYRDMIEFGDALRVHPIPPLDGIYVQWDHIAGEATRYFNPSLPEGIPVDGSNTHEAYGNLDDPCNTRYDAQYHAEIDRTYRETYRSTGLCERSPYHQSIDVVDLTSHNPQGSLQWEQVTGPNGTVVTRWSTREVTPGGAAQGIFAVPYYRDDSCFDDGTGTDPGPKINLRSADEATTWGYDANNVAHAPAPPDATTVYQRKCWEPTDDPNLPDVAFYQGSIATHGLHLLFVAESDNVFLPVPVTEIDSVQRMVVLPGCAASDATCNVGDRYGRSVDVPLRTTVAPYPA